MPQHATHVPQPLLISTLKPNNALIPVPQELFPSPMGQSENADPASKAVEYAPTEPPALKTSVFLDFSMKIPFAQLACLLA